MSKSLYLFTFAAGALIGSVATHYFVKKKYEQISRDEIQSVKESYDRYYSEVEEAEKKANEIIIEKNGYDKGTVVPNIYTISPDEFGEEDDYKIVGLTYFSGDDKLVDDNGDLVDVDSTVGVNSLTLFGEYVDDAVYVRNEDTQTDYEILLDVREYLEVHPNKA